MLSRKHLRILYISLFTLFFIVTPIGYSYYSAFYPGKVSDSAASQIKVSEYYPTKLGTVITTKLLPNSTGTISYANYITQKYSFEDYANYPGKTISQHKYIINDGKFTYAPSIVNVNDNSIKIFSPDHKGIVGTFDRIVLTNKSKWEVLSDSDIKIVNYIESINETISTKAGTFKDCIKITSVYSQKSRPNQYVTSYYAKGLGPILHQKGTSLDNQKTLSEIYEYYIPNKEWDDPLTYPIYTLVNNDSPTENVFRSNEMNIEIPVPANFKNNYTVDNTIWQDNIESCINISLKYKSLIYQPILSIIKLKKGYGVDYLSKTKHLQYLGEYNGYTYCYAVSTAPNVNVYSNSKTYKTYKSLVSDIPYIIRNFKFVK
ncbi:MAG: hypothetical protein RR840_04245 [Clostridium sp.]